MQREGRPWGAGNAMKEKEKEKQSLKVVIVGNGKVGFSLAEQLVKEKYDVTIVDMREDSLRRASDALDIMSIRGNGVSAATLADAGAAEADLLVAATNSDEVNMVCCLTAKHMGAKFTIARIRNPEYNLGLHELKKNMGIDMVIIPGDTTPAVISALIADEAAIGMVNSKTTAVRVIPAIGRKAGEVLDFGGLLGYGPIMPVNSHDPSVFINRGGRLPAPMQSLKN